MTQYERPRSIFQSITSMFNSAAGAVEHGMTAVSKVAETTEVLADTGLDMATSNQVYMRERTAFTHEEKMDALKQDQAARDAALLITSLEPEVG